VSTPGNVNAWESMWKEYGGLDWPKLFAAAIRIADEGFVLTEQTASMIGYAFDDFPDHARSFYGKEGRPLKEGEVLIQTDLAHSLRVIAELGAKAVYGGEIGRSIDAEMKKSGGFLSLEDLTSDRAEWWNPIHIE